MKEFIKEIVSDVQMVIPEFSCVVGESEETLTMSCKLGEDSHTENIFFSKDMGTENLLRSATIGIGEMISDTEPYGIVVEPKAECEFKVSDPFFDNLDECSGGFYPSYTMKDCSKMVSMISKYLCAIGMMKVEKQKMKNGAFIRLYNKDSDIRLSLRVGTIEKAPVLIIRFGDYRNYNVVTQVIDGAMGENGRMYFMAIEFVNTLIPQMIELSIDLVAKRHAIRIECEKIVAQLFADIGWVKPKGNSLPKLPSKE